MFYGRKCFWNWREKIFCGLIFMENVYVNINLICHELMRIENYTCFEKVENMSIFIPFLVTVYSAVYIIASTHLWFLLRTVTEYIWFAIFIAIDLLNVFLFLSVFFFLDCSQQSGNNRKSFCLFRFIACRYDKVYELCVVNTNPLMTIAILPVTTTFRRRKKNSERIKTEFIVNQHLLWELIQYNWMPLCICMQDIHINILTIT